MLPQPPSSRLGPWIGRTYRRLHTIIAGTHPNLRPTHYQWLSGHIVYRDLHHELGRLSGRVLDVGCGQKPYRSWMTDAESWLGIDVVDGPDVDVVIRSGERWPVEQDGFDVVLCTQVVEHVSDPSATLQEIACALSPGGTLVMTVPFTYNEHDRYHDYRRLTRQGARTLVESHGLEVVRADGQGGIGSSTGVLLLNWVELRLTASAAGVLALLALLPFWLTFCAVVNAACLMLDRLDNTEAFYGNVIVLAVKPWPR